MIEAFFLSLRQIGDRRIVGLLFKVMLLTLLAFALFGVAVWFGVERGLAALGLEQGGALAALAAIAIVVLAGWLLFRAIAILILNIFSDDIVAAVEEKHYPARAETARPPNYRLGLKMGIASVARALLYNLAASPFYLLLFVTGIGTFIAFFAVNALLLGRDLQDMVAARHTGSRKAGDWGLSFAGRTALGAAAAGLLLVPGVNLFAPVVAASMATHMVHRRKDRIEARAAGKGRA